MKKWLVLFLIMVAGGLGYIGISNLHTDNSDIPEYPLVTITYEPETPIAQPVITPIITVIPVPITVTEKVSIPTQTVAPTPAQQTKTPATTTLQEKRMPEDNVIDGIYANTVLYTYPVLNLHFQFRNAMLQKIPDESVVFGEGDSLELLIGEDDKIILGRQTVKPAVNYQWDLTFCLDAIEASTREKLGLAYKLTTNKGVFTNGELLLRANLIKKEGE